MTPEQKAEQARRMIESPIWTECWENVQKDLFEQFCANVDLETRQRISFAMDLITEFDNQVRSLIVDGTPLKIVGDNDGN